ncbi:MAG: SDR family oxidoreductase [Anaerolineae bacterium]|nr:SDR family oxidoreductase [Anaerolineae bacterium]MDW8172717.1 SDR family oxidoreductase [Anaerolineae bacterium]
MSATDKRVVLITGASSGIGRASALAFAALGDAVVVVSRNLERSRAVVNDIAQGGGEALALAADVGNSADVERMIAQTMAHYGRLDVLFNNAGISPSGRVTDISEAEWDECLNVDLKSVFLACKHAIPHMIVGGGGVILTTAGTFGLRPAKNKAAYSAAKAAAINLTKAIALDYAREGIRANVIAPGVVQTPLLGGLEHDESFQRFLDQYQPLPGLTQPQDVAALAVYLASDAAQMMTGQVYVIDGGQQTGLFV